MKNSKILSFSFHFIMYMPLGLHMYIITHTFSSK